MRAEREVILCGGAYHSPHLLMHSGVGPAEVLTGYAMDVLLDQPEVGANLQDHAQVTFTWTGDEPVSLLNAATPEALEEFESARTGPLTSNGAEAGGFLRTRDDLEAPDVQLHLFASAAHPTLVDPVEHGLLISACVLKPHSTGSVSIASARADREARDPPQLLRRRARHADRDRGRARSCWTSRPAMRCGPSRRVRSRASRATTRPACAPTPRPTRRPSTTRPAAARSARSSTTTCA